MNKKVAILGFGVEGRAAWRYFRDQGAEITILDERPPTNVPDGVRQEIGPSVFERAIGYDIVVRSPSIRPDRIKTDGKITTVTKEFFEHCPAPIIGVTGTKGKGTTASLIRAMLQTSGKKTYLVGNIGIPSLEILDELTADDIVVYELSSFQLWDLQQSPHIAVVLMVEPEHLDVHKNAEEYFNAKANVTAHQTKDDVTIYLPTNPLTKTIALQGVGQKIPYTQEPGAHVESKWIVMADQAIIKTSDIPLPGQHNIDNICAAVTAAWRYTQNTKQIAQAIKDFRGLDHRLKLVGEVNDVAYYDDSIATTPGSAIAALRAFNQPKIIILGGSDKGADFTALAQEVARQNVKIAIVIGQMRNKIEQQLSSAGFTNAILFDESATMQQLVAKAYGLAKPGDVVILSPACASYDMFKSYADRGDQFTAAVQALSRN